MSDRNEDPNENMGTLFLAGDYYEASLIREIQHSREMVWKFLTDPGCFVDWLAPGEIELKKGGVAKLNFTDSGIIIDSALSDFESGSLLEYSWSGPGEPDRPVRWTLIKEGDDATVLTLQLKIPESEDVARSCAGWEAHLMMLLASLEGVPIKFPFERFQATRQAYNEMLAP